jgi:hypothetical protein
VVVDKNTALSSGSSVVVVVVLGGGVESGRTTEMKGRLDRVSLLDRSLVAVEVSGSMVVVVVVGKIALVPGSPVVVVVTSRFSGESVASAGGKTIMSGHISHVVWQYNFAML